MCVCVCVCVTGTPGKHVFNRRGLGEVFLEVCDLKNKLEYRRKPSDMKISQLHARKADPNFLKIF